MSLLQNDSLQVYAYDPQIRASRESEIDTWTWLSQGFRHYWCKTIRTARSTRSTLGGGQGLRQVLKSKANCELLFLLEYDEICWNYPDRSLTLVSVIFVSMTMIDISLRLFAWLAERDQLHPESRNFHCDAQGQGHHPLGHPLCNRGCQYSAPAGHDIHT